MRITTLDRLQWLDKEQRKAVYKIFRHGLPKKQVRAYYAYEFDLSQWPKTDTWVHSCHHFPSYREVFLAVLNEVSGTYGVECIRAENALDYKSYNEYKYSGDVIAKYLNTGETYCPTLIYRYDLIRPWVVMSWGDLVELYERKGVIIL